MTTVKSPDLNLAGSLLVVQFNEMVATAIDIGLEGYKEVNRFKDNATGIARTEKLHAAIQARVEALRAADAEAAELEAHTGRPANTASPETSGETTAPASVDAEPSDEEAVSRLPGETEEAFMARKKATKKTKTKTAAKKAGNGNGARTKSTNGTTIREMTDEYNAIVAKMTKAQKEAAPFAKHHTSQFESKDKAKVQLDKLKKAIAKA